MDRRPGPSWQGPDEGLLICDSANGEGYLEELDGVARRPRFRPPARGELCGDPGLPGLDGAVETGGHADRQGALATDGRLQDRPVGRRLGPQLPGRLRVQVDLHG